MSERDQFEAAWIAANSDGKEEADKVRRALSRIWCDNGSGGGAYFDSLVMMAWTWWQASREALKAEQSSDRGFMFVPVADLYAISTPETKYFPSYTTYTPHAEDVSRAISDGCEIQEYVKLERLQDAMNSCPDYPDKLPCPVLLEPGLRFGKGVPTRTMLGALQRRAEYYAELEAMTPEQRAKQHEDLRNFLNLTPHPIDTTPNQYDALGKGGEQ